MKSSNSTHKTRSRNNSQSEPDTNATESADLLKKALATPQIRPPSATEKQWIDDVMSTDDTTQISDTQSLARLLKYTLNTALQTQQIVALQVQDVTNVKHRVSSLESDVRDMDQYSRKDVSILTGLAYPGPDDESEDSLVDKVLETLHYVNPSLQMSYKDFSAIHRNGKGKGGNPPSITLKFLRLHEKEKFMTKSAKIKFKSKGLNIFHGICKRMLDEQKAIERTYHCDFVFYAGPRKHFSVKLKCGDFLNYVRNFSDFETKKSQHECPDG